MTDLAHPSEAWQPQTGPQVTFARTSADFAIIGGSPGGGKSVACLYEAAKLCHLRGARRVRATFFRRDEVSLHRAGSIWDRAREMLPAFDGTIRLDDVSVTIEHVEGQIEDQHRIDFRHLHRLGDERSYDGSEQDLIVFEELQEFDETQVWYMISRLRTRSGLRPRLRASCNADPECEWLVKLLSSGGYLGDDGYIRREMSGVVKWLTRDEHTDELLWYATREAALEAHPDLTPTDVLSFTFVLATPWDNPALMRSDPGYLGRLRLQLRKDRVRLIGEGGDDRRGGCWFTTDKAGDFFALDALRIVSAPPSPIVRRVRGWDFGSSEPSTKEPNPDFTEGALVALCENGELYIEDLVSAQKGPLATTELVVDTAAHDGPLVEVGIFQDTGAAGKRDAATLRSELEEHRLTVHVVHSDRRLGDEKGTVDVAARSRGSKRAKSSPAKQALARPWSLLASQGRVFMRGPLEWNKKLIHQAHKFPNARKDDAIDAISCAVQILTDGGTSVIDALEQLERAERRAAPPPRKAETPRYDGIDIITFEDDE